MKLAARRTWYRLAIAIACLVAATGWIVTTPRPAFGPDDKSMTDRAGDPDRGRIVFAAGDCASCHASPGQGDRLRLGGGLAVASPYGTLRVPNISQDPVDGVGSWRTVDLANAMMSGVSPSLRHYYPVFPYGSYARMQPGDVVDLMAYMKTLPAVPGRAPTHELSFPFNVRRLIGFWKLIYLDRTPIEPIADHSAQWNRGRYLVNTLSHCAECHSSRNLMGGIKPKTRFAGGRDPEGTGFVPNITPTGIGTWSAADITALLEYGRTPDLRTVGSSMASVVENTRSLSAGDRDAIAVYLMTLPARPTPEP
jgi:mono/diheme cytochrome c family protein